MTALAYIALFLSGSLFALSVRAVIAMWRNPTPPEGHHLVNRGGKRFVRRNPKRSTTDAAAAAGEGL